MHLTVLRASRQIYVEANRVLWTTNTFSFDDGPSLGEFTKTMKPHQKQLIRNLRFEMCWSSANVMPWNSALSMALVKSFTGLQTLRLQILCNLEKDRWDHNKDHFVRLSTYTEGIRRLSILPLQSTEIVVRSAVPTRLEFFGLHRVANPDGLWQKGDWKRCAEDLKALLLDPKGADVYADNQATIVSRRVELNKEVKDSGRPWLEIP